MGFYFNLVSWTFSVFFLTLKFNILFMKNIKVIAFDADDTLWENENFYFDTEMKFCELMSGFVPVPEVREELLKTEISNIELYGYGAKSFILSMIETAMRISEGKVDNKTINSIIGIGKDLINMPVKLLDGVEETLAELQKSYKLVLATKGDLLDQERKLHKSGIAKYFDHVEVMSNKRKADYLQLIQKLGILPAEFLMIGNTVKSDIIPVIEAGGKAVYIPFHITWEHEQADSSATEFVRITKIPELMKIVG
jgi:putative hydrolase of the HAD superfamily